MTPQSSRRQVRYSCGKQGCDVKVKDDEARLKCEKCYQHFHLECTNFNKEAYNHLSKSNNILDEVIWCCVTCRPKAREAISLIETMDKKLADFEEKMEKKLDEKLKLLNQQLTNRYENLETNLCENTDNISKTVDLKCESVKELYDKTSIDLKSSVQRVENLEQKVVLTEEEKDKERRKYNLIFYKIPESDSSTGKERMKFDCVALKDIFERKNVHLKAENIERIFRLGDFEKAVKPRPILIKFKTVEYKKSILSQCSKLKYLKNNVSIPVFYSLDLTEKERKERKKLVDELKSRKEKGEDNIGIRKNKIVVVPSSFPSEAQRETWATVFESIF